MAHTADLTFFKYSPVSYGPSLAIGWLDNTHQYEVGKVPIEFLKKLGSYVANYSTYIRQLYRGIHDNNLKTQYPKIKEYYQENISSILLDYPLGNGEFHFHYNGRFYVAPAMTYEYIIENGYKPPEVFIQAVLKGEIITENETDKYSSIKPHLVKEQWIYSNNPEVQSLLIKCGDFIAKGKLDDANEIIDTGLIRYPNFVDFLHYAAYIDIERGRCEKALEK